MIEIIQVPTAGQGLVSITDLVNSQVVDSSVRAGLCTLFVQHTSASLLIQENYDASAQLDLEAWMNRLVPEGDSLYTHTLEGADDMPAHIKASLTATSIAIPVLDGKLALGTWQGVYLWEHRKKGSTRTILVHFSQ